MSNSTTSVNLGTYLSGLGTVLGVGSQDTQDAMGQYFQYTLTAAQILSMFATPIVILPATIAGTGRTICVDYVLMRYTSGGTAFAGGGAISVGYVGGSAVATTLAASVINSTTSSDTILGNLAANLTALQNTGIQITNGTAAFTTGNGTLQVQLHYSVN